MADNVEADAGSGGATFATDDIGGVHYPRTKIALGAANAVDMDLDSGQQTMANSVPVAIASDQSAVTVAQATAANLNVTEASAAAIKTAVEIIDNAISGAEMQVDIVTSALPTGAATSAKQDTIIGHVDGIEGLLTTIDGDTGTLAGAVSGLEMQVDVVGALPAGTNAIGKLAANSGVDIGDVDVTSVAGNVTVVQATASSLNAQVVGAVAHDANVTTPPVMVGTRARTTLSAATLVATHDAAYAVGDLDGVIVARSQVPLGNLITEYVAATTSASTAFSTFNATTLLRNYITCVVGANNGATRISVDLRNGTGGGVMLKVPLPAGGGAVIPMNPPLRQASTNTALAYDASAALGGGYSITVIGFQSKL